LRAAAAAALDDEIAGVRGELSLLNEQEKMLAKVIADLTRDTKDVGEDTFQMALALREVQEAEKLDETYKADIRALELDLLAPPRAKPLDQAIITRPPGGKKRFLLTAGSALAALACSLLGVGWWEFRKRKIDTVDEVIHGFGIRMVGTLPTLPP